MKAVVCNSMNWTKTVDMDQLRSIAARSMGPRHNPVNHGEMLERFKNRGTFNGVEITDEQGLLSPDGKRYMYVAETRYDSANMDFSFTVGFVNFNDRSRSFTGLAGMQVFVCSNLTISGMINESRTRHSTNVESRLDEKIDTVFAQFANTRRVQLANVDAMKATKLTDELLGKFILWSTRQNFMGSTNLIRVINEVDRPTLNNKDDSSLWRLHNAATYVIRENINNPVLAVESTKRVNDGIMALI